MITDSRATTMRSTSVEGVAAVSGDVVWVQVAGEVFAFRVGTGAHRSALRDQDALAPPMAGRVGRVLVQPGQAVRQGDLLVALEAMKMEFPIRSPRDAVVTAVHCKLGDLVQPGAAIVTLGDGSVFHRMADPGDRPRDPE
jgi:3-methylcrotonyl-CoA carboxylase alpha subunit